MRAAAVLDGRNGRRGLVPDLGGCGGDVCGVRDGVQGRECQGTGLVFLEWGGRGSRLMFRAGQQGNVFITLGARPPAVSAGNASDDATA